MMTKRDKDPPNVVIKRDKDPPTVSFKATFLIKNEKGLHTRPSTELVKCASSFKSHINLSYQNVVVNAKSLLGILTLGAPRGARIEIEAVGEDAKEAVQQILQLASNKFYIHY